MLGTVFVVSGADVLRRPDKATASAGWLLEVARSTSTASMPPDRVLVQANAAVQLGAGAALTVGRAPRAAALVLAGSLVPTSIAGHAFWRFDDPVQRKAQRVQLLKNLGLMGGLMLALTPPETTTSRKGHT